MESVLQLLQNTFMGQQMQKEAMPADREKEAKNLLLWIWNIETKLIFNLKSSRKVIITFLLKSLDIGRRL